MKEKKAVKPTITKVKVSGQKQFMAVASCHCFSIVTKLLEAQFFVLPIFILEVWKWNYLIDVLW